MLNIRTSYLCVCAVQNSSDKTAALLKRQQYERADIMQNLQMFYHSFCLESVSQLHRNLYFARSTFQRVRPKTHFSKNLTLVGSLVRLYGTAILHLRAPHKALSCCPLSNTWNVRKRFTKAIHSECFCLKVFFFFFLDN